MTQDVSNEIISLHRRVLAYLEQQRATLGVYTPPYIQLEIEEKTRQIERLMHYSFIFRLRREVLAHERPAPHPGAILLVSPEEIAPGQTELKQAAFDAIGYHQPELRYCWLIASAGTQGSLDAAAWLAEYCRKQRIGAAIWPIDDASSIGETMHTINLLYASMEQDSGLHPRQVVADITGATKPMSIGLLYASRGLSPIEYMIRQDDGNSLPILLASAESDDRAGESASPI